jgi:hypothetical protein
MGRVVVADLHCGLDREAIMTVLLLMTVISAAAISFLVCFFSAIRKENTGHTRPVVRISSSPVEWRGEVSHLRSSSTILLHRNFADYR